MENEERGLVPQEPRSTVPMTALQIREQVNLIQSVMKEVMTDGQHYGVIEGCGNKPTLLKPGAEKLSLTFRLRPIIDNDRDVAIGELPNGHIGVRVYCHVMNMAGTELATGVGSCSTMESKYRYRGGVKVPTDQPVPKEYWNLKKEGKTAEALDLIGGKGFGVMKHEGQWVICELGEKQENPDIADTYNTVLKMAKKRAYVDGILSATAASDIFTQDIEDMPNGHEAPAEDDGWGNTKPQASKPKSVPPKAKSPSATNGDATISEAQGKRLFAIAMGAGMGSPEVFKQWLDTHHGYKSSRSILVADYEKICEAAGAWSPEDADA